ncbi:MAG: hypothetical protein ACOX7J_05860 [Bacillota bacterium]|jgi:hypothetical protein
MKKFIRVLGIIFLINGLLSLLYAILMIGYDIKPLIFFGMFGVVLMFIGNRLFYWNPRLLPKSTHYGNIKYQYNNVKIVDENGQTPNFDFNKLERGAEFKLKYDRKNEKENQIAVFYKNNKIGYLKDNKNVRKKIIEFLGGADNVRAMLSAKGKAACDIGLYK